MIIAPLTTGRLASPPLPKLIVCALFWLSVPHVAKGAPVSKSSCAGMANYERLAKAWNTETRSFTTGTWQLPTVLPRNLPASRKFLQSLDGPTLYVAISFDTAGCVAMTEILKRRSEEAGMASIVAWIKLIKVYSPELSAETRKGVLEKLGIMTGPMVAGGDYATTTASYSFREQLDGNVLSVRILK